MKIHFLDPNRIDHIRNTINDDPEFNIAAKYMSQDVLLEVENRQCIFKIRDGVLKDIILNPSPMEPWNYFIKGPEKSWELFLRPKPPPFYHSLFGASLRGDFQFGGDVEAMFAHYWATLRMFAVLRQMQNE